MSFACCLSLMNELHRNRCSVFMIEFYTQMSESVRLILLRWLARQSRSLNILNFVAAPLHSNVWRLLSFISVDPLFVNISWFNIVQINLSIFYFIVWMMYARLWVGLVGMAFLNSFLQLFSEGLAHRIIGVVSHKIPNNIFVLYVCMHTCIYLVLNASNIFWFLTAKPCDPTIGILEVPLIHSFPYISRICLIFLYSFCFYSNLYFILCFLWLIPFQYIFWGSVVIHRLNSFKPS